MLLIDYSLNRFALMRPKFILTVVVLLLCICSFVSHFITYPVEDNTRNSGNSWEEYDSTYFYQFQSVQDVITAADRRFALHQRNSLEYYNYIAEIIRKRFYHGYSYYNLSTNPIAFLAGKFCWNDLSAIVIPDDIMKHPMAACSQQSIVLMEIFKRQGIDFRKVGFTGHFAVEGKINGDWKYFDTNLEPNFGSQRASLQELIATRRFDSAYSNVRIDPVTFHKEVANPIYGKVNADPAPNATLFHHVCYLLQSNLFLAFALLLAVIYNIGFSKVKKISLGYKQKLAILFERS